MDIAYLNLPCHGILKYPTCFNNACFKKNALNAAKSVILLIFRLKLQIQGQKLMH